MEISQLILSDYKVVFLCVEVSAWFWRLVIFKIISNFFYTRVFITEISMQIIATTVSYVDIN